MQGRRAGGPQQPRHGPHSHGTCVVTPWKRQAGRSSARFRPRPLCSSHSRLLVYNPPLSDTPCPQTRTMNVLAMSQTARPAVQAPLSTRRPLTPATPGWRLHAASLMGPSEPQGMFSWWPRQDKASASKPAATPKQGAKPEQPVGVEAEAPLGKPQFRSALEQVRALPSFLFSPGPQPAAAAAPVSGAGGRACLRGPGSTFSSNRRRRPAESPTNRHAAPAL